jgi:hypothetical protein
MSRFRCGQAGIRAPWSSNYPCGIDEGRDGLKGLAAAHKPGNYNAALCEGCS